jgi:hypothetical protein
VTACIPELECLTGSSEAFVWSAVLAASFTEWSASLGRVQALPLLSVLCCAAAWFYCAAC